MKDTFNCLKKNVPYMGVTNCSLIGFKTFPLEGIHAWYYKPGQIHVRGDHRP